MKKLGLLLSFAIVIILSGPVAAADKDSEFGTSFTNQAPAGFTDPQSALEGDLTKIEPAAGNEETTQEGEVKSNAQATENEAESSGKQTISEPEAL